MVCSSALNDCIFLGEGAMASAIGEGQGAVWPMNDCGGTAVWGRKFPGGPLFDFIPRQIRFG